MDDMRGPRGLLLTLQMSTMLMTYNQMLSICSLPSTLRLKQCASRLIFLLKQSSCGQVTSLDSLCSQHPVASSNRWMTSSIPGMLVQKLQEGLPSLAGSGIQCCQIYVASLEARLCTTVESVLLYGSETACMIQWFKKWQMEHIYTWLLCKALNISWKMKVPNSELYGGVPRPSTLVTRRRLQFACHYFRAGVTQYQPRT